MNRIKAARRLGLKISCIIIFMFVGTLAVVGRPATVGEIRQLFRLATVQEFRVWVQADITYNELQWTPDQVSAELSRQAIVMKDYDHGAQLTPDLLTASSNNIARAHSGRRTLHVQEWYSEEHYYRLGNVTPKNPGGYVETFVDIDNPSFSPFRGFH